MCWEFWIALIVAAGIWILGHLLRNLDVEEPKRRPVRLPDERGDAARPAAGSEEDRFLELQRRRPPAARPVSPPPRRLAEAPDGPRRLAPPPASAPPRPARPPQRPPLRPQQPPPSEARTRTAGRRNPPILLEVVEERTEQRGIPTQQPGWQEGLKPVTGTSSAPTASLGEAFVRLAARQVRPRGPAGVVAMLRSPQDLRAAVLLREILDPPLALRGPRHP